jgi:hypothetical protein
LIKPKVVIHGGQIPGERHASSKFANGDGQIGRDEDEQSDWQCHGL